MDKKQKRAYLHQIYSRYHQSNKNNQSKILDEFCSVCKYNRKYAIRLLNKPLNCQKKKTGPQPTYKPGEILNPLKRIWFTADQPCSLKLKAIIPKWIQYYEEEYGVLSQDIKQKLLSISRSTIDRILKPIRAQNHLKGISGTKPGTILKNKIEIKTNNWDVTKPGFVEADTVALCGNSIAGYFVWCVNVTDILSGWTEVRATWNKGAEGVLEQINNIEKNLAFELLGFDCDNGSEFLNYHLFRYLGEREKPVTFTRSRPYKKNDNAHIEQKNWTHVRQLFGYDRFNNQELVSLMNDLLTNEWSLYQNHFLPVTKLIKKERVNSKYKKKYDIPKTPYARLINSPAVSKLQKVKLAVQHNKLNPFILKREIEKKLRRIFSMVKVTNNMRQRI